ncbi:heavy-metal-associated domain-containing protein [Thiopseudomonas alkaliphila]|uniref:heavy-metal-associated domain-containing protein n=1 Tax=Thiopseudomonas alkaliphila TaxID=1697053 RepID=UPI00069F24FE|nr:heavy-metal-associated domain-containing protein [Thiopseudomonas alkaliphila]AKX53511.1 heavy metal transporter [Thiopseudomonas alkaliphila]MDM1708502.1 heavy-metal-associated domain-containing protein [Thiopseudomonas alkaliphila]
MTTFNVADMTCGHCEKVIRQAFATQLPQAVVTIDLAKHQVTVEGVTAEQAQAVIKEEGYTPELAV